MSEGTKERRNKWKNRRTKDQEQMKDLHDEERKKAMERK